MRSLKEVFFGEGKNRIDQPAHRGIDYMPTPGQDFETGIREMQAAYDAFDALMLGVKRAAESTDALTKGDRERSERQNVLHRKAVERRRKRKRGGKK